MARQYDPYADEDELVRKNLMEQMGSPAMTPVAATTTPAATETTAETGIPAASPVEPVRENTDPVVVESAGTGVGGVEPGGVTGNGTAQTATIDQPTQTAAGQYANMLQGFDSTKLADAQHTTPKYTFARLAQNYAPTPAGLTALAQDPAFAAAGFKLVGTDKIQLPNGEIIDVGLQFSTGGGKGWAWQPETTTDTQSTVAADNPFTSGTGSTSAGTSTSTSSTTGGASSDLSGRVNELLMQLMGQDPSKVTESPTYNAAVNAYDVQAQRAAERERNAIAERMDATGTSGSGAYDQALLKADQTRGENTASFASNLALQELNSQRQQIMQALQLSAGLMSDQQKMALTERLAQLDAAIQRQQMSQQNQQFYDNLGWDMSTWEYLANQGWLS